MCEWYLDWVVVIKCIVFDCGFIIDIFFGFYFEMEEDYWELFLLMEVCGYDVVFMFKYLECFGIYVFKYLEDNVFEEIKVCWLNEIIVLQNCLLVEFNNCCIGKMYEVLVEGVLKCLCDQLFGWIEQNRVVVFDCGIYWIGDFVNVRIMEVSFVILKGEEVFS